MFKLSSRLGCRFALICVCAVLTFVLEAFFSVDPAFALGRRGRMRNSQMYSSFPETSNYYSYPGSVENVKPAAVQEAPQPQAVPEKTAPKPEASEPGKVDPGVKTATISAPQLPKTTQPVQTVQSPKTEKASDSKPAEVNLALRANPALAPVAPAPSQLPEILCYWFPTLKEASQAASSLGRPMLLHFYLENCGPCNWMEQKVLTLTQIQKLAGSYFVTAKLNGKEYPEICSRVGITSFPADVIVSSDGKYITHNSGRQDATQYSKFLMMAANYVKLPPMNKPVGPNWQKQIQLPKPAAQTKEPTPEMTAALEMPALDPPVPQKNSSKQEEEVVEEDLFALSSPKAPASAETKNEELPVADELDLMALGTKKEIRREDLPESAMDHMVAASETPIMPAGESMNQRRNINPTSFSQETKLLLEGFSPVALVEENRWVPGNENLSAEFENAQYYFASEEEKEKFVQNPSYYALVSSGNDIVVLAESSRKVEGNRRFGVRFEERNFVFSSAENLEKFRANPEFYATKVRELAHQNAKVESVK